MSPPVGDPAGEQAAYRERVRELVRAAIAPGVDRWERDAAFPREVIARLGQEGLLAACLTDGAPSRRSGALRLEHLAVLVEEVARAGCFGLLLGLAIHVGVFLPMVNRLGSPGQRERVIAGGAAGALLGGIAATEPGVAGSDLLGIQTRIDREGDRLFLTGEKAYITNVPGADHLVVLARWRPERHFASLAAVLVPLDAPGVAVERIPLAVMRVAAVGRVAFDRVALDADAVLGRKELGLAYFQDHIATERLMAGVWAGAVAEDVVDQTRQLCASRRVGEETLWERSAVRQTIGRSLVQLSLLRALVDRGLRRAVERGGVDPLDAALVKAAAAPTMESILGDCLQLHGAAGLVEGSPLLRAWNELRVFGVAGGSTETMLDQVAELWRGPGVGA